MKVLIIGGKGMLGGELVDVFRDDGEVISWDKEDIDITQQQQVNFKITELQPDVVINAAAFNDVDGAEEKSDIAKMVNGHGVGFIAEVCKELDIPVVHYSSEYVFDGEKKEGYAEEDVPSPVSVYGESKYLGEKKLREFTDKYYLIRLSRLFGKQGESEVGKKSFVQLMLELADEENELEVIDEELSSPTYAKDLAVFTKKIIQENKPFGIYHGANEGACTWYGLAEEIFKQKHKNVKLIPVQSDHFDRKAERPKYGVLVNTKLPKQRDWKEALADYLESDISNPKS